MPNSFIKDPDAVLDYSWDWLDWLGLDTIASSALDVGGLTEVSSAHAAGVVTAVLSGGLVGKTYAVRCRIVTTAGRTDDRTIFITVRQR